MLLSTMRAMKTRFFMLDCTATNARSAYYLIRRKFVSSRTGVDAVIPEWNEDEAIGGRLHQAGGGPVSAQVREPPVIDGIDRLIHEAACRSIRNDSC